MKRDELNLLLKQIDVDWIENNTYETFELMQSLIKENLHMIDRLEAANEGLKFATKLCKDLNKENKKLSKEK